MNFDSIKTKINIIKKIKTFEEKEYLSILNNLDEIYCNKKNSIFNFSDLNYILVEKENFRLFLIENLFRIANEKAKNKEYKISIEKIKELNKLIKSSEKEIKNKIDKLNSFCVIGNYLFDGNKMIENKEFEKAIKYFKNLIISSKNAKENEIYKNALTNAKNEFIKSILIENINLLKLKKYDEIFIKCEEILKEFQYESKLKNIISETKKFYKNSLENKIEENLIKNKICFNELEKYKTLIEMENTNENKIKDFEEKIKIILQSEKKENQIKIFSKKK